MLKKAKYFGIILFSGLLLSVSLCGCKKSHIQSESYVDVKTSETEPKETVHVLMTYPEHKDNIIQTVTGEVLISNESANQDGETEESTHPFLYFGNPEFGYGLVPDTFQKINDTSYRYTDESGGTLTLTIDGYEKGDFTFEEWVRFIEGQYADELNYQVETEDANYVCLSFNPNQDTGNVSLVEITDDTNLVENEEKSFIHISVITGDHLDPAIVSEFYPYGHFDYKPYSFLEKLGDIKLYEQE